MSDAARAQAPWPAMSIAQAHAILTAPGAPFEMEELVIRGVRTRAWKNAPPSLRAVVEAGRAHGEKIFLVHEDERVTFEAFFRAVVAFARELESQGVVKGDRVAIEHNGNIVPRGEWANTSLADGDRLEIVHFVGGGRAGGSSLE